jgi:hypothetical protein
MLITALTTACHCSTINSYNPRFTGFRREADEKCDLLGCYAEWWQFLTDVSEKRIGHILRFQEAKKNLEQ